MYDSFKVVAMARFKKQEGGTGMEVMMPAKEKAELFEALDKGIDDMENNRVTPHEESMKILKQRFEEHVLQNP